MDNVERDWRQIPPIPGEVVEAGSSRSPMLSEYLASAFEASFGIMPIEVSYSQFPDGLFACLVIGENFEILHNVWAVLVAEKTSICRGDSPCYGEGTL